MTHVRQKVTFGVIRRLGSFLRLLRHYLGALQLCIDGQDFCGPSSDFLLQIFAMALQFAIALGNRTQHPIEAFNQESYLLKTALNVSYRVVSAGLNGISSVSQRENRPGDGALQSRSQ